MGNCEKRQIEGMGSGNREKKQVGGQGMGMASIEAKPLKKQKKTMKMLRPTFCARHTCAVESWFQTSPELRPRILQSKVRIFLR